MATTFNDMLEEGIFDTITKLGALSLRAVGKSAFSQKTKDMFSAALGNQQAAGRLDTAAMLTELQKAFKFYCGQQGLEPTAMAVVEFLTTIQGETQVDDEDGWVKWLNGTPDIRVPSPSRKAINAAFNIIVKNTDDVAVSKAVAKIEQIAMANREDRVLVNNWMRMLSMTKPDLLRSPALAPILQFLDRDLSPQELTHFFTMIARDMLRSKTVQDIIANKKQATNPNNNSTAAAQQATEPVDNNPKTTRTNFTIPIGTPVPPFNILSNGTILTEIHNLDQELFNYIQSSRTYDGTKASNLLIHLAKKSNNAKYFNSMSARVLAYLTLHAPSTQIARLYDEYAIQRKFFIVDNIGVKKAVGEHISSANMLALCNWIKSGGTLDEVTAEFNATIPTWQNSAFTVVLLASLLLHPAQATT